MKFFFVSQLILLFSLCVSAEALPDFVYDGAKKTQERMQKYDRMVITQQTEEGSKKTVRFGQVYEASYRLSAPHDFEHYTHRLKANLLKRAGYQKNIADRQRFFQLARTPEQWISITVFRDHYVVRYFRQSSYPDTVSFDTSRPYAYSERLKKLGWTVPPNTYIPHIRAFEIEKALYTRKGAYQFTTQESNHSVEGEVWKIKYAWRGQQRDEVRRYAILHQFRDLVTLRGAEILFEDATHIVFRSVRSGENIWGLFGGNDFSVSLVLVQASSRPAQKILNASALKHALDTSGRVTLKGIYFDTGKSILKPASQAALKAASLLLHRYPALKLSIEGHTDNTGNAHENLALSQARAEAVKVALVQLGVDPVRLSATGFGDTKPVASNDTESGRAANRRVELHRQGNVGQIRSIDAFFFKPEGDAKIAQQRTEAHDSFDLNATRNKSMRIRGRSAAVRYILIENGRRARSVSAYEIFENVQSNLSALGGKILEQTDESMQFLIPKGDGENDVYGKIDASMGAYRVYTIAAENVEIIADKNSTKKAVIK